MVERKSIEELEKMTKTDLAAYMRDRYGIAMNISAVTPKSELLVWCQREESAMEFLQAIEEEAGI